ncbi:hypothetical protein [Synechococcus sp. PCC 6312]|uniref:hypothetical protein n=1 Tax=Synechococcus sp. (strain ATCC 27167 / PCC 6312) TaxID=195253 RepID=UPI00029ED5DE|nr:hypothetical protein [Synechococcus sp. PCC 6312]AFY60367.1 hypothetical protein Syn6312_1182 [Synechococcus sp. PCC 6312]
MDPSPLLSQLRNQARSTQIAETLVQQGRFIYKGTVTKLEGDKVWVSIQGQPPIRCQSLGGSFGLGEFVTVRITAGKGFVKKLEAR